MNVYKNKVFRIILGVILCVAFIKISLHIGRTYWGTMMFLTGTYLFLFYTFFSIIDSSIEKAVIFHEKYNNENIKKQPLNFFMMNRRNIATLYKLPFNLLYMYCVVKFTVNTFF